MRASSAQYLQIAQHHVQKTHCGNKHSNSKREKLKHPAAASSMCVSLTLSYHYTLLLLESLTEYYLIYSTDDLI